MLITALGVGRSRHDEKEVPAHVTTLTLIVILVATWNTGKGELLVTGIEHAYSMSHRFSYAPFCKSHPLNLKL